jgi:hypothetical protein
MEIGWNNGPWLIEVSTIMFFVIIISALTSAAGKLRKPFLTISNASSALEAYNDKGNSFNSASHRFAY